MTSRGIHMHIPILTGVQNERKRHWKECIFLLKNVFLEASFPWWRSLLCQLLVLYSIYSRWICSIFLGPKWAHKLPKTQSYFAIQMYLLSLISKTIFTCMPLAYFIFFFCFKCFLFKLLLRGIRMHIPILTGVQIGRISLQKNSLILLKNFDYLS